MSTVWSYISSVWVTYGSWIGVSLIPTIIAGLSISPRTAPEAAVVQKVWGIIKQIMGIFSVATFKDAPGTFQLPLKLGKIKDKASVINTMLFFLVLGGVVGYSGCAWFVKDSKAVGNVVLHCSGQEVTEKSGELVQVVLAAAGTSSLEQIIEALVEKFSLDVAGCAVISSRDQVALSTSTIAHVAIADSAQKVNKLNLLISSKKWVSESK